MRAAAQLFSNFASGQSCRSAGRFVLISLALIYIEWQIYHFYRKGKLEIDDGESLPLFIEVRILLVEGKTTGLSC